MGRLASIGAALVLLAGCAQVLGITDPSPPEDPSEATQMHLANGDGQMGAAGSLLTGPLVVIVEGHHGEPIQGREVTFVATAGGGMPMMDTVLTDPSGQAATRFTLGPTAGTNTIEASAGALMGSPVVFTATATAAPAANLAITFGDLQAGAPHASLEPLVVTVLDVHGNPVPGVDVSFSVTAGDGTLSAPQDTSDAIGHAQTTLTLGTAAITAVAARLTAGPSAQVTFTGFAVSFAPHVDLVVGPPGSDASSIALADYNGDGKLDLAVGTLFAGSFSVLLNTTPPAAAAATFAAHVDIPADNEARFLAAGDLNGDGRPDLVYVANTGFSVFLNTTAMGATTPSFAAGVPFALNGANEMSPRAVAIGDLNGDGNPDLAFACTDNSTRHVVAVLLNQTPMGATTASFASPVDFNAGKGDGAVALGDFNGDGKPDVVTANGFGSTISVLLNTMATGATIPTFAANADFSTAPFSVPTSVAVADFNGDGKPDLAVTNQGPAVSVLLDTTATGATTPSFAASADFLLTDVSSSAMSIAAGDFNGDGKPDLAVADFPPSGGSNAVTILINATPTGAATARFSASLDLAVAAGDAALGAAGPTCLGAGDLDGDGKQDLVVAVPLGAIGATPIVSVLRGE